MAKYHFNAKENAEWLAKLPKKSIATKAIIRSNRDNVLLVKPNYKKTWQLPGGGVEASEEPRAGLVRELKEELNLSVNASDLKLLDAVFRQDHDNLILIYEYSIELDEGTAIHFQEDELEGYKYEKPDDVAQFLSNYYADFWQRYIT